MFTGNWISTLRLERLEVDLRGDVVGREGVDELERPVGDERVRRIDPQAVERARLGEIAAEHEVPVAVEDGESVAERAVDGRVQDDAALIVVDCDVLGLVHEARVAAAAAVREALHPLGPQIADEVREERCDEEAVVRRLIDPEAQRVEVDVLPVEHDLGRRERLGGVGRGLGDRVGVRTRRLDAHVLDRGVAVPGLIGHRPRHGRRSDRKERGGVVLDAGHRVDEVEDPRRVERECDGVARFDDDAVGRLDHRRERVAHRDVLSDGRGVAAVRARALRIRTGIERRPDDRGPLVHRPELDGRPDELDRVPTLVGVDELRFERVPHTVRRRCSHRRGSCPRTGRSSWFVAICGGTRS